MLGCGELQAFFYERGGARALSDALPDSGLRFTRRLNEISDASVSVPVSSVVDDPTCDRGLLGTIDEWEAELTLFRDGQRAWTGPTKSPQHSPSEGVFTASDLFLWFERRILREDRLFDGVDLSTIFALLVQDAMANDPSPNIGLSPSASGVLATRVVQAASAKRAADELRDIARSGVDFTMIDRTLLTGGPEIAGPDLPKLTQEHVRPVRAMPRGSYASLWVVLGANINGSNVRGEAGGFDLRTGLVEQVANQPDILSATEAQASAETRLDFTQNPPSFVTVELLPTAPVRFDQLIPGVKAPLAFDVGYRRVEGVHRLTLLEVSRPAQQPEVITATFAPVGSEES